MEAAIHPQYAAGASPVKAPVFVLAAAASDIGMSVFVLKCNAVNSTCGVAAVTSDLVVLEVPVAGPLPRKVCVAGHPFEVELGCLMKPVGCSSVREFPHRQGEVMLVMGSGLVCGKLPSSGLEDDFANGSGEIVAPER